MFDCVRFFDCVCLFETSLNLHINDDDDDDDEGEEKKIFISYTPNRPLPTTKKSILLQNKNYYYNNSIYKERYVHGLISSTREMSIHAKRTHTPKETEKKRIIRNRKTNK